MDGLALNTIYNKETGKNEFCKSRQILVLWGQAKSAAASDSRPEQGVQRPRFPELWWPAPATVDTAESRLTSGDTSSGHKPGFPAKTYAHQVTHPPCIVFSPTLPIPLYFILAGMFQSYRNFWSKAH